MFFLQRQNCFRRFFNNWSTISLENDLTVHHNRRSTLLAVSKEKLIQKKNEYIQSFTVHGLTKICTGTKAESVFWLIMLLLGLALSVYVVYRLVSKYLQFEIYTEVSETVTTKNFFPAITFCDYQLLVAAYFSYCGQYIAKPYKNPALHCSLSSFKQNIFTSNTKSKVNISNSSFFNITECTTWGSKECKNDKYIRMLKKLNNVCFTWNYNGDLHDAYSHAFLQFEVKDTKRHSYIVAMIHDPRVTEFEMTNRVILEPKKHYEFRILKTVFKRLPSPYPSNCTSKKPNDIFPGKYTRFTCLESLGYINAFKTCGDVFDYHREYIPKDLYRKYKRNRSIAEISKCLKEVGTKKVEASMDCPFPCDEIQLLTTSSSHGMHGKEDGNRTKYRVDIQYHNVDSYKVFEEKVLFSWDQVVSEVGGLLGLVIGASVISVIEILAYFYLCCIQKCEDYYEKKNRVIIIN